MIFFRFQSRTATLGISFLLVVIPLGVPIGGQVPEIPIGPPAEDLAEAPIPLDAGGFRNSEFEWFKADTAIRIGLDSLAIESLRRILENAPETPLATAAGLRLANVLLANGDLEGARAVLASTPVLERDPVADLLRARIFLAEDRLGPASRFLSRIDPERFESAFDRGWYHLATAMILERRQNPTAAREAYTEAFDAVGGTPLEDRFRVTAFLNGFRSGRIDQEEALRLQSQLEASLSPPIRAQLILALGLGFHASGESDLALETLRDGVREFETTDLPRRHLLKAALAYVIGLDAPASRPLFRDILDRSRDRDLLLFALNSLLRHQVSSPEARAELRQFLTNLPASRPDHPLLASIRFAEGFVAAADEDYATAITLLNDALIAYPENTYALAALETVASVAVEMGQNRIAADALIRSLPLLVDARDVARRWRLIGDLYYRNRDFANAADAYRQAASDSTAAVFAEIAARIANGDLSGAVERLDQEGSGFDPSLRWEAEWNLSTALIRAGKSDEAIARIRALAEDRPDAPSSLQERLSWLQVYALLESGRPQQAANLARVWRQAGRLEEFDPRVRSLIYLLEGQAFYDAANPESGANVLRLLREEAPGSEIAVLSLLVEARFLVERDEPGQAINDLVDLSRLYPDSEYAPVALFEAGLLSATLRSPGARERGFQLLDQIITDYPEHYLAFHARYRMGELLLAQGNFTAARVAYEKGRREFVDHPDRFFLELGVADATLANPDATPEDISRAASRLRILAETETYPQPVRIESAVKRARALERNGRKEEARSELWDMIQRNTMRENGEREVPTDPRSRFWLARAILSLAENFRSSGDPVAAKSVQALLETYGLPGANRVSGDPSRSF